MGQKLAILNVSLLVLMIFTSAFVSAVIFVYSCIQAGSSSEGIQINNQEGSQACSNAPLNENRPLKITIGDNFIICGWPASHSALRIVLSMLSFFYLAVPGWGLWKKQKMAVWTLVFVGASVAFIYFIAMCMDSNSVRSSQEWCSSDMPDLSMSGPSQPVVCDNYTSYVITAVVDAGCMISWAVTAFAAFYHVRKHFDEISTTFGSGDVPAGTQEEQSSSLLGNYE